MVEVKKKSDTIVEKTMFFLDTKPITQQDLESKRPIHAKADGSLKNLKHHENAFETVGFCGCSLSIVGTD